MNEIVNGLVNLIVVEINLDFFEVISDFFVRISL